MSGPGDIGGEVSGDEAAWRDLIARFDAPADRTGAGVPWPAQEDLPDPAGQAEPPANSAKQQPGDAGRSGSGEARGRTSEAQGRTSEAPGGTNETRDRTGEAPGRAGEARGRADETQGRTSETRGRTSETQSHPSETQRRPTEAQGHPSEAQGHPSESQRRPTEAQGHPSEAQGHPGESQRRPTDAPGSSAHPAGRTADAPATSDPFAGPSTSFAIPVDRTRVIRPAGLPRSYTPPEEAEEPYVPEPLPPPAKLDSVSKAALAGVIAGPGYLLIASIFLHWTISAGAALVAVAAFVAGFVTLVVKLGDRPGRDDDDDGAVL